MNVEASQATSSPEPDIWTVRKVLKWSADFLRAKGSPSAQLDAEVLLAHALKSSRIDLYTQFDKPLSPVERADYRDFVKRRSVGEPVAYIVGTKGFWRSDFHVNRDVLIPRPETELIIETSLALKGVSNLNPRRILDVGTGSGCVAISLAQEFSEANVVAWDNSAPALSLAEENASRLGINQIQFEKKNALDPFCWCLAEASCFDLIVSNPPYICQEEREIMDQSVINFEPHAALFAEQNGMIFYQYFSEHAQKALRPLGWLIVEVGMGKAGAVKDLFTANGWNDVKIIKDLAGIERVVCAKRL